MLSLSSARLRPVRGASALGASFVLRPVLARSITTPPLTPPSSAPPSTQHPSESGLFPPHLLTLGDLTAAQIQRLITKAMVFKAQAKSSVLAVPGHIGAGVAGAPVEEANLAVTPPQEALPASLAHKSIALIFSKRSTRTRVASETATQLLGGHPMFLGSADIQLGVNESLHDTARVVSSMADGIMARVGHHSEIEEFAKHSAVPVVNALSHLYHPTQILADIQTLLEVRKPFSPNVTSLQGLTVAWVGDSNNILNEMIVTLPRLGVNLQVAIPRGYYLDDEVMEKHAEAIDMDEFDPETAALGINIGNLIQGHDPLEAVKGADVIVTDTWISMGQEEETAKRLKDFAGYQVTEELLRKGGANEGALFMHCLPRHKEEVDDEVFYGPRSVVFPEAENRKWTIMACFDSFFGQWKV